jgi:hypothetical protein
MSRHFMITLAALAHILILTASQFTSITGVLSATSQMDLFTHTVVGTLGGWWMAGYATIEVVACFSLLKRRVGQYVPYVPYGRLGAFEA